MSVKEERRGALARRRKVADPKVTARAEELAKKKKLKARKEAFKARLTAARKIRAEEEEKKKKDPPKKDGDKDGDKGGRKKFPFEKGYDPKKDGKGDNDKKPDDKDKKSVTAGSREKKLLEEIRLALRNENISFGELVELTGLVDYIEEGDVELLEAAGVPEFDDDEKPDDKKPKSLEAVRNRIAALRKVKAVETDENGVPVVGGAPEVNEELNPPAPGDSADDPSTDPIAEPAPVVEEGAASVGITDETASVIVQVNEKLDDIGKREEVDKAVKTELEEIQRTLTSTAAKLTAHKVEASERPLLPKHLTAIVDFLGKVDAAYDKRMVGFEATASVKSVETFNPLISKYRVAVDVASEKAHNVLASYNEKKATGRDLKDSIRELKASVEQWGAVETMTNFFKREASVSSSEVANVLKVVAFVQDMVVKEKLPIANVTAQVKEYLTLSPVEFKSVAATMNRMNASVKGTDKTPESMNPVQSSVGNFGLDDCFD